MDTNEAVQDTSKQKNYDRLKPFGELEDNWDGYGAEIIPKDVLQQGTDFLDAWKGKVEVFPTGRGTIQFKYENDEYYWEIEIYLD